MIRMLKEGDSEAFRVVYKTYKSQVMNYCLTMVISRENAEELVHDIFLKLWQKRSYLDESRSIGAYLNGITKNMVLSWLKTNVAREKKRLLLERDFVLDREFVNHETAFNSRVDLDILQQQINKMPLQRRLIFKMCKMQEMTYAEVANTLSLSRKTVENQMTLANRQIAELVNAGDYLLIFLLVYTNL